jgi:tRNA(Ile)-lysidine synthase
MPRTPPPPLDQRVRQNLETLGVRGTGAQVMVAVSGGVDSVALLHLLRFAADDPTMTLSAAHFDHGMRPGSEADARWVRGLCRAWGVPLSEARADHPPRTEEAARDARYAFLRAAQAGAGATHLATAHHADDQAETVLFRVLRGTGIHGLAGIPPVDATGLIRPLLPFWRAELRRYARAAGLRWREDPSNRSLDPARNRIRRGLLPRIERTVAAGARASLVRLAQLAREDEAAWEAVLAPLLAEAVHEEDGAVLLVRERFAAYDWPVAARLLRAALRRLATVPDRAGTRTALEFISRAPSGRTLRLAGGVLITTEFGVARLCRAAENPGDPPPDLPLAVAGAAGEGRFRVGGRERVARWAEGEVRPGGEADAATVCIAADRVAWPLALRGWMPGDRMRTRAGTRPLKKLFGEARMPVGARRAAPVLADAAGSVLWVPGVGAADSLAPRPGERAITFLVSDV